MIAENKSELEERDTPKIRQLLSDIEPFFYARPVVYFDVGAHRGDVFREVQASSLTVRAAHLIEPNPTSYAALRATVQELGVEATTTCHNVALAGALQRLRLRDAGTMTKVIGTADGPEEPADQPSFDVEATTLDTIVQSLPRPHVSILKVDVEGYEREVFAGATALLDAQAIDLIYVEAGMDPAGTQQTYYRDLEDLLRVHGYRLFRVYEQTHEWIEDSPLLRRVNLAFLSTAFAAKNPYRLSRKLFAAHAEGRSLKRTLADAEGRREAAEKKLVSLNAAHDAQTAHIADLEAKLRELQGREDARTTEAERLEAGHAEALAKRDTALARMRQQLEAQANEIEELKARLATRFKELAQLTKMLEVSNNEAQSLRTRIDALMNSTSWRIMGPVRGVITMVRSRR